MLTFKEFLKESTDDSEFGKYHAKKSNKTRTWHTVIPKYSPAIHKDGSKHTHDDHEEYMKKAKEKGWDKNKNIHYSANFRSTNHPEVKNSKKL